MTTVDIKVPAAGESITEGVLGRWLADEGTWVTKGQTLFELETDKTTAEVPAPEAGRLQRLAKEGDTVAVHAVVARIATDGAAPAAEPAPKATAAPAPVAKPATPPAAPTPAPAPVAHTTSHSRATPLAKLIMAESGIDSGTVRGSGLHGRIMSDDVFGALKSRETAFEKRGPVPSRGADGRPVRRVPIGPVRRAMMDRMVKSYHSAAMLTTFNEVDMSAAIAMRARFGESFAKRHGVAMTFAPLFFRAAVEALRTVPRANGAIEGEEVLSFEQCDIGFQIDTPSGAAMPVLRNAESNSIPQIERWLADARIRARDGKLALSELAGGTFSIVDDGPHGALMGVPMLNAPQTATLGLHRIKDRAVADEKKQAVARPMMYLSLAYDHRLLDGKDAVEFLIRIKDCMESPERLLLEV